MEPGVPFALLGAGVLLAVAGWAGLAVVAAGRLLGPLRAPRLPAVLLVAGGLLLAVVEALGGLALGGTDDALPVVRLAGLLLVGGGTAAGGLPDRPRSVRLLVAGGLALGAAAAGLALLDDDGSGGATGLALRTGTAGLLLAALLLLTRASVLGQVVAAILAGVLVMAAAAVGVVGTVVADAAQQEQASLVRAAAQGRLDLLQRARESAQAFTTVAAPTCLRSPTVCGSVLADLTPPATSNFAVVLPATGEPVPLGGRAPLEPAEALALAGSDAVATALAGGPGRVPDAGLATTVRLVGGEPSLANVVVVPLERPTPDAPAPRAFAYGVRLDDDYVGQDPDTGGFGYSLLVGEQVVASNLTDRQREVVGQLAREAGVGQGLPDDGRTVAAQGDRPTVQFVPLTDLAGDPVGTLALSRDAAVSLGSQRDALRALLLTALLATAVVGGLALLLGRRTTAPLQRLTSAASRVAAGDLGVRTAVRGRDEVAELSRTFDAMTGSVARLTGDLRASATRLEAVLSSMTDGLVGTDRDGRVTSLNRAAVVMTGLPDAASGLGRTVEEVLDVRADGVPLELRRGPEADAEVHPADGGDVVPVRVSVEPLSAEDGTAEGLLVVLRDTTREREVERMKTEFLSNVSHELRTPLTPIRGYADILASRPGLPADKVTTFAGTILAESLKMNRVVDLLVDVAALEAGRVTVSPRPLAPGSVVDERLAVWRERVPERAGDLKRRVAGRLPQVLVDPEWLGKALDELVDNAVRFSGAGSSVTVGAAAAGGAVRVFVRDTGPGIAEADRALLFTSFEQVDGSATRRVGGLGLGLSFVRRVADDAGWVLTVRSTPGKGAEFALDLPLAPRAPAARPRRRRPARA